MASKTLTIKVSEADLTAGLERFHREVGSFEGSGKWSSAELITYNGKTFVRFESAEGGHNLLVSPVRLAGLAKERKLGKYASYASGVLRIHRLEGVVRSKGRLITVE